jgi:hypothetical protein
MADDEEEIKKYVRGPSQILNSLKELQRKEEYFFMRNSKKTFIELEKELKSKNTYFGKLKYQKYINTTVKFRIGKILKS